MIYVSFNNGNKFMSQEGKSTGVCKFKVSLENIFSRVKDAYKEQKSFGLPRAQHLQGLLNSRLRVIFSGDFTASISHLPGSCSPLSPLQTCNQ